MNKIYVAIAFPICVLIGTVALMDNKINSLRRDLAASRQKCYLFETAYRNSCSDFKAHIVEDTKNLELLKVELKKRGIIPKDL